jgi:hypothetical protein
MMARFYERLALICVAFLAVINAPKSFGRG